MDNIEDEIMESLFNLAGHLPPKSQRKIGMEILKYGLSPINEIELPDNRNEQITSMLEYHVEVLAVKAQEVAQDEQDKFVKDEDGKLTYEEGWGWRYKDEMIPEKDYPERIIIYGDFSIKGSADKITYSGDVVTDVEPLIEGGNMVEYRIVRN